VTDFAAMPLGDVAALNTPKALDYFWAHVDSGYFEDRISFYADVAQALTGIVGERRGFALCDYGCGCGHFLQQVRHRYPDAELFGVDYALSAITKVRALRIGARAICKDFTHPVFLPQSFDYVTCIESLEHIIEAPLAVQTMLDSLKPSGVVLITVPNNDDWQGHVHHWTETGLREFFSDFGAASVHIFRNGHNLIGQVVKR